MMTASDRSEAARKAAATRHASDARRHNDGLRKRCDCPRRLWAKCPHPWHFNFRHAGQTYRFTLDRVVRQLVHRPDGWWGRDPATLGDLITSKTDAERERDRLRTGIRAGTFNEPERPQRDTLTVQQLVDRYTLEYLKVHRAATLRGVSYAFGAILRAEIERPDGRVRAFGEWLACDCSTDVIELYRRVQLASGRSGRHHLQLLRALFGWASSSKRRLVADNPFRDGDHAAVKVGKSEARTRRLQPGEGERLLAACGPHLWAVVQCALETGMRRGEILSLQWWQIQGDPPTSILLPAQKTKTRTDRRVPVSSTLRAILDMRRTGPDGEPFGPQAYVFGNEVGEPVQNVKRAWSRAVLVAHGVRPCYVTRTTAADANGKTKTVTTALLTPASREALARIDLHFHDLRREAGSRWLDHGVSLHRVQAWLGHANISQTSTYLRAHATDDAGAMAAFEARLGRVQTCATDSETGVRTGPVEHTTAKTNPLNHSGIH
jgi:integrase